MLDSRQDIADYLPFSKSKLVRGVEAKGKGFTWTAV